MCPDDIAAHYKAPLRAYHLAVTSSAEVAIQYVLRAIPPLLVVDGDRDDAGLGICESARSAPAPPSVLVTLSQAEAAGRVIDKCDSILLKPFAPNLLTARVARMLRIRSEELRERSAGLLSRSKHERAKSAHLLERTAKGLLVAWPNQDCPYCGQPAVILFDYGSVRRAWYACGQCRTVWMALRLE